MSTIASQLRRYRAWFILTALLLLTVTALATNASAWTSEDLSPVEREYRSAFVYYAGAQYWRGENVYPSYTTMPVDGNYRGYISYDVSHLDDDTFIESASLTVIARNSGSFTLEARVVDRELHELDPQLAFETIYKGTSAGTIPISTGLAYRTFTLDITGNALQAIRDSIAGDDVYLVIGFNHASLGWVDLYARYVDLSGTHYSTLTLEYDDEAPDVPPPVAMDPFITGDRVPVTWSPASDNPAGGNRGEVTYQVGVYLPGAPADNPYHTGPWTDGTSWNLTGVVDNATYTFRVRARDGSGFTSDWSAPVDTTVDNSPPATPLLYPEPPYTRGWNNTLIWWPCLDAGVGNVSYEYEWSFVAGFPVNIHHFTNETFVNITDLQERTYYYRVRSIDGLGHVSPWSPVERSTQDASSPTTPIPFAEPLYTPGTTNTFSWHPSMDDGVGVDSYYMEVAYDHTFFTGSIVGGLTYTKFTSYVQTNLSDKEIYYFRVRAIDTFGHESDWSTPVSSTQDASPPSAPLIHPLPDYVPEGPVTISWSPAEDYGVGVARYEVFWDRPGFPGPPVFLVPVIGQSLTLTNLGWGNWTFSVRAVDWFGHVGPWSSVNTTIDGTPPTAPYFEDVPGFSKGTSITLTWPPSTDELSGVAGYRVSYYREGFPETVRHIETERTSVSIFGLEDNTTYWYGVFAYDAVGNEAGGQWVLSTVDASPPPAPYLHFQYGIQKRDHTDIVWSPVTDNNGMAVEYQLRGSVIYAPDYAPIEFPWTTDLNLTIEGMADSEFYQLHVVARDSLGWISEPSNVVSFQVDIMPPEVRIHTPTDRQVITGTTQIHCEVDDGHPNLFFIQYRPASGEDWEYIVYWTEMPNPPWFFASWDTTGLPDGDYVVRATHVDDIGWQGYSEINVTLANAHLSVTPGDITVSETSPKVGDTVTMTVTVHNLGDSTATNVSIDIYDNGVLTGVYMGSYTKVPYDIPERSSVTVSFEYEVTGTHVFTARAHSHLYDSGEMPIGLELKGVEEESERSTVSDSAAWIGVLAIILAVIAIALNLVGRRSSGAEDVRGEDEWVESVGE